MWGREFFHLLREVDVPADFLSERPMNQLPVEKDLLARRKIAVLHMLDTDIASYIIKERTPAIQARMAAILPRSCVCRR